jgi:hypothetical protein
MTNEQAFYLLKHFTEIDQQSFDQFRKHGYSEKEIKDQLALIGSKFQQTFCQNPFQLEPLVRVKEPIEQIIQSNSRIASVYQFDQVIGTEQIVARNIVNQNDIFQLDRNGVILEAIKLDRLPLTEKFVVVRSSEGAWITAFPGNYAPAFPSNWMSSEELNFATQFWQNHVFVTL